MSHQSTDDLLTKESTHGLRPVLAVGLLALGSWAVVLGLGPWVRGIADFFPPDVPVRAGPVLERAALLYLAFPLWLIAVITSLLAPGLVAVLHQRPARSICETVIRAFGLAFALRLVVHALGISAGVRWSTGSFIAAEALLLLVLWLALLIRAARGYRVEGAWGDPVERRRIGWLFGVTVVLGLVLLPWVFWQDMNGDSIEVLEIGRSLATHIIPRSRDHVGFLGLGVGMLTAAYPVHWFVALLGPLDASARLPVLLYAPLLFAIVVELAETRSPRRMAAAEEFAVLLAMISFVVALGLNGSQEPYGSDLAMPGSTDLILVVCVAAALLFLWRRETLWFVWFAMLACFDRSTGFLFLLLLVVALAVLPGPDRRGWAWRIVLAIGLFMAARFLYEGVYLPFMTGAQGSSASILQRLQYLRFTDIHRFLFVIVPTGLVPSVALLAVRRHDPLARMAAVVCVGSFCLFYVEAFFALHHFVLAMFFPVVVWWRVVLHSGTGRVPAVLAAVGAGLAIVLAVPPTADLYRTPRAIAARTVFRVGDYLGNDEEFGEALEASSTFNLLFRRTLYDPRLPDGLIVNGSVILHYSARLRPTLAEADYVVQPTGMTAPAGFTQIENLDEVSVFVGDSSAWMRDRQITPRTDFQSWVYTIPRETLKRYIGVPARNYDLNLRNLPVIGRLLDPPEASP